MLFSPFLAAALILCSQQPSGGDYLPTWRVPLQWDDGFLQELPDLDGDGVIDVLHTDYHASDVFSQQGAIQARSGASGEQIWEILGSAQDVRMGFDEPVISDLNGDGQMEILVYGYPLFSSSNLRVLDSITGKTIWEQVRAPNYDRFAWEVWIEDLMGDGTKEIITMSRAAFGSSVANKLHCFLADGTLAWEFDLSSLTPELFFEDLNQDGSREVILGLPDLNVNTLGNAGKIFVLNPLNGVPIWEMPGTHVGQRLGAGLQFHDLDATGDLDILAPCPWTMVGGMSDAGSLWAMSGSTGALIWRIRGAEAGGFLGEVVVAGDLDGNGNIEIVLGLPKYQSERGMVAAFRGHDGTLFWQNVNPLTSAPGFGKRIFLSDLTGDGSENLLVESLQIFGSISDVQHHAIQMLDLRNGATLWQHYTGFHFRKEPEIRFLDLFHDGISQILITDPTWYKPSTNQYQDAGLVYLLKSNGSLLWLREGTSAYQQLGQKVLVGDLNGDGNDELLIRANEPDYGGQIGVGMLEVRESSWGTLLWAKRGSKARDRYGSFPRLVDLDMDGSAEIVCSNSLSQGWRGIAQGRLRVLKGDSGEVIFTKEGNEERAYFPSAVIPAEDLDGDGWLDLIALGNSELFNITGNGNFSEFLHSSGQEVSIANGGSINLQIDFTPTAGWYEYLVLLSAHGPGLNYEFDIPMPLTLDHWVFLSSAHGLPPSNFKSFFGVLDRSGRAMAELKVAPSQIPISLLGESITLVTLARNPWMDWEYCSVPQTITIVP